jgi:hypothetical protein
MDKALIVIMYTEQVNTQMEFVFQFNQGSYFIYFFFFSELIVPLAASSSVPVCRISLESIANMVPNAIQPKESTSAKTAAFVGK